MLDAFFLHHRDTPNVGDLECSPGSYFDFGTHEFGAFGTKPPATKRLIMGGGQTWKACVKTAQKRATKAEQIIVWGVGIQPASVRSPEFAEMKERCDIVTTRCAGLEEMGARYMPCASAMSEHFDTAPEPSHDVVMFAHSRYSGEIKRMEGVPEISNHDVRLKDAIHHIASGETVVTSSYHGTYWALLLGRRVICVPFSRKFNFFPQPPSMATPDDWPDLIGKAHRYDDALEAARRLNHGFFEEVMNL